MTARTPKPGDPVEVVTHSGTLLGPLVELADGRDIDDYLLVHTAAGIVAAEPSTVALAADYQLHEKHRWTSGCRHCPPAAPKQEVRGVYGHPEIDVPWIEPGAELGADDSPHFVFPSVGWSLGFNTQLTFSEDPGDRWHVTLAHTGDDLQRTTTREQLTAFRDHLTALLDGTAAPDMCRTPSPTGRWLCVLRKEEHPDVHNAYTADGDVIVWAVDGKVVSR